MNKGTTWVGVSVVCGKCQVLGKSPVCTVTEGFGDIEWGKRPQGCFQRSKL
jgi:hypothetical protein